MIKASGSGQLAKRSRIDIVPLLSTALLCFPSRSRFHPVSIPQRHPFLRVSVSLFYLSSVLSADIPLPRSIYHVIYVLGHYDTYLFP